MLTDIDIKHLGHRGWLTHKTVPTGNPPCGRLLLGVSCDLRAGDCTQIRSGDRTRHPEQPVP